MRLGALGVVRAQIHVDQAPVKPIGDLRAETVDVIVVAVDADDAGAVNGGIQNFGRLEIGGDKDAGVEALLGGLRGHRVREVAGGGAADSFKLEAARGDQCS